MTTRKKSKVPISVTEPPKDVVKRVEKLLEQGKTQREIGQALTDAGFCTAMGAVIDQRHVSSMMKRVGLKPAFPVLSSTHRKSELAQPITKIEFHAGNPDPLAVQIVRDGLKDGLSQGEVAKQLNDAGFCRLGGHTFLKLHVHNLINAPWYQRAAKTKLKTADNLPEMAQAPKPAASIQVLLGMKAKLDRYAALANELQALEKELTGDLKGLLA